jgi:two-component system, NarL family, invasion response regulator UvrY
MTKILIADDHTVVRKGIIQIIQDDFPFSHIDEAGSAEELIKKVLKQDWDIVITDITMGGQSGLDAMRQIKISKPLLPVLILSMHPEKEYAVRVLKAGASGYLNKETAPEELINAIRMVLSGKKYITSAVADAMVSNLNRENGDLPHMLLSDREFEIMKLIAGGKSTSEISELLNLSATTVSTYRSRILTKMQVTNNAALTLYVLENKL